MLLSLFGFDNPAVMNELLVAELKSLQKENEKLRRDNAELIRQRDALMKRGAK